MKDQTHLMSQPKGDDTWMQKTGGFAKDMTLRDHFAGLAFEVRFISSENWTLTEITQQAYADADAMLKARDAK
jgi:hypothetical protein